MSLGDGVTLTGMHRTGDRQGLRAQFQVARPPEGGPSDRPVFSLLRGELSPGAAEPQPPAVVSRVPGRPGQCGRLHCS